MENVLDLSLKDAALMAVNQKLILQGVSWDFYEQILKDYEDSNALHFAYDDGFLEVEVPLSKHEIPIRILSDFVTAICVESEINFKNLGSTTFRRKEKTKGCEPDTAFYIQSESSVRGIIDIDLKIDPPPDLFIEVDVTSPSLNKFPIYAALGVKEVWVYRGERVEFYKLYGEIYDQVSTSLAFPFLSDEVASTFLKKGLTSTTVEWFKEIREWIKNK